MNDTTQPGRDLAAPIGNLNLEIGQHGLPPSLQILLNDGLYNRVKQLSGVMANAQGFTPQHLVGKPEACFAVINMSLDWKLNPHFVARHTYQTPGGQIGYDGALVQSILEQSGRFIGAPTFEYRGDWGKLTGKFAVKKSDRGRDYVAPTWTAADATGLGVIVRWQVKGEDRPRAWPGETEPFWLTQCYPLNSPLWATDPKTQIAYLAIRRFANLTSPGILGASSFDQDELLGASDRAIDVTPRRGDLDGLEPEPQRPTETHVRFPVEDGKVQVAEPDEDSTGFDVVDLDGTVNNFAGGFVAFQELSALLTEAAKRGAAQLEGFWESNQETVEALAREGFHDQAIALAAEFDLLRQDLVATAAQHLREKAPPPSGGRAEAEGGRGDDGGRSPGHTAKAEVQPGTLRVQPGAAARTTEAPIVAQPHSEPPVGAGQVETPPPPPAAEKAPAAAQEKPARTKQQAPPPAAPPAKPDKVPALEIAPVLRQGKHDWRVWAMALFLPKLRRITDAETLPFFLGDNEAHIEQAKRELTAADRAEVEQAIAAQWQRVEQKGPEHA